MFEVPMYLIVEFLVTSTILIRLAGGLVSSLEETIRKMKRLRVVFQ